MSSLRSLDEASPAGMPRSRPCEAPATFYRDLAACDHSCFSEIADRCYRERVCHFIFFSEQVSADATPTTTAAFWPPAALSLVVTKVLAPAWASE